MVVGLVILAFVVGVVLGIYLTSDNDEWDPYDT